jgi:hypothetical protein
VDSITNYIQCKKEETKIMYVQQWQPIIEQYFKQEDVKQAMLIVYCESRGKANAVGTNKDKSKDKGLWQFNDRTWAWLTPKLNIKGDRFNPELSTAVASWLVYNDGWHHWNSSSACWKKG